jgi:predicted ArsR family transcriptional regulator
MVLTVPSDTPNSSDMWVREISARLKVSDRQVRRHVAALAAEMSAPADGAAAVGEVAAALAAA